MSTATETDLRAALLAFCDARLATLQRLRRLTDAQLARTGEFAEYGRSLRAWCTIGGATISSTMAGIQRLAGKITPLV